MTEPSKFEPVKVNRPWIDNIPGLHRMFDLPQRKSIAATALGTGWWELDQILKLYEGQFVVVTGIAGSGKSTFVQNLIVNVAREHGLRTFLYAPENEQSLVEKFRLIKGCDDATFKNFATDQVYVQSAEVDQWDEAPKTLEWVLDRAAVVIKKCDVGLVVVDPWNEIERAKPKDMLLTDYIGYCLMMLKRFTRYFSITTIMIAHPTKAGIADGKVPSLSDIEGSMNWYNKCDNGLVVVRDDDSPVCRVISAKVREIGAGKRGVCFFNVDPHTGKFTPQYGAVS